MFDWQYLAEAFKFSASKIFTVDNRTMAQSVSESENDSEVSERDHAVRHNTSGRLVSVGQTVKGRGATLPEIQVGVLAKRVCNSINQHGAEPYFTQF